MKPSCGIITNIAPLYSRPLWYELNSSQLVDYYFYSSKEGFSSIKTIYKNESVILNKEGWLKWYFLKNVYLNSILIYQIGAVYNCLITSYNVYLFNGEMNCLSTWLAALVCKLRRKPVIFWGHGLYGNEKKLKKVFRILFYKIADWHLVYGNRSRRLMIEAGFPEGRVFTVYNSLNFEVHQKLYSEVNKNDLIKIRKELFPQSFNDPVLIFLGRLTKEKKVNYLVNALGILLKRGRRFNCLIVGDGEDKQKIRELRDSLKLKDSVYLFGECYDESLNAMLIMAADCCISPGNIGLTGIHSLSLGTPVITHGNMENQMPEVEAIIPGKTGQFFKENDIDDLSDVIDRFVLPGRKKQIEDECINEIRKYWNPQNQGTIFDNVVTRSLTGN